MATADLKKQKIAFLVADGFEQVELTEPRKALDDAGAITVIVSPKTEYVRSWEFTDWGSDFPVEVQLDRANARDFDALLLPGGVINPDTLRIIPKAVDFVKAGATKGRRMTSWPSLRSDLRNAGAEWVDQETVVDKGLVTSRKPDDIPAFNREVMKLFGEARAGGSRAA